MNPVEEHRVLITGARGQLGHECMQLPGPPFCCIGLGHAELDICDPQAVEDAIQQYRPQTLINTAAFTQVDRCETEPETADHVNADGPRVLAESARRHGLRMIHISTDYVFDGARKVPEGYREDDVCEPVSAYGRSKRGGEAAVLDSGANAVVVRTSWVYGLHGANFLKAVLARAVQLPGEPLRVVNDQHGSPTWARTLALQLARLVQADIRGIVHASGLGFCSWFEFAVHFFELLGLEVETSPCSTREFPRPAPRPSNSILLNRRLDEAGLNLMRPWQEDLREFVSLNGQDLVRDLRAGAGT